MYKISVKEVIDIFNNINKMAHNGLVEMSIKKSRINFEFNDANLIHYYHLSGLLDDDFISDQYLYMTALENHIHVTYDCVDANTPSISSPYYKLFKLLEEVGEHICQCPALEYIISKDYVKVFIDKPNIEYDDLINLRKVFGQSFSLELQKQRPYCLFVPTNDESQTDLDGILNTTLTSTMVRKI